MNEKDELLEALRLSATTPTPAPSNAFVDGLEQRLLAGGTDGAVVPFARRARRLGAATVVAITCTVAGVAAAAGIVVTRPFSDDAPSATTQPAPSTTAQAAEPTSSTTSAPATTLVAPPESLVATTIAAGEPTATATPSTLAPATTVPAETRVPPPLTPPTTAAVVVEPTLPPPTTVPTQTTEVHTAATVTLACASNGSSVQCDWSPAPAGTVRFAVLRSQPGSDTPGRVFFADATQTSWTDPMATPGVTYVYLVHAFDAADHTLGHSPPVEVSCC